ncbi:MAG: DNA alkylation repair protein [Lentisphaeria bacterium]|nr:DNA alkylation repair protein [Lentisphaeria bacterium]
MAELLKDRYDLQYIESLAGKLQEIEPLLDAEKFKEFIFNNSWRDMELKERMQHITKALNYFVEGDYQQKIAKLQKIAHYFNSFEAHFFPNFVAEYGRSHVKISLDALEYFTQFSSSEFAIRPFIIDAPVEAMNKMLSWAKHPNAHVRRLASEGCRPRLPWASPLRMFQKNPKPILPILEILKNDPSRYVTRSVANNLNDIAKDHPQLAINCAQKWKDLSKETNWIIKHGMRSLLKAGEISVLRLFDYHEPSELVLSQFDSTNVVRLNEKLAFSFLLSSRSSLGRLRVEFAIDFLKANQKWIRKVFMLKEFSSDAQEIFLQKAFSFEVRTTRKYYTGNHRLIILVNGIEFYQHCFKLNA